MKKLRATILPIIFVFLGMFLFQRNPNNTLQNLSSNNSGCVEKFSQNRSTSLIDLFVPKASANKGKSPAQFGIKMNFDQNVVPEKYFINIEVKGNQSKLSYSYSFDVSEGNNTEGIVNLYPPDSQYDTEISICVKTNKGDTNSVILTGKDFWNAVSKASPNNFEVGGATLTVGSNENRYLIFN